MTTIDEKNNRRDRRGIIALGLIVAVIGLGLLVKFVWDADAEMERQLQAERAARNAANESRDARLHAGREYLDHIVEHGGPPGTEGSIKQAAQIRQEIGRIRAADATVIGERQASRSDQ